MVVVMVIVCWLMKSGCCFGNCLGEGDADKKVGKGLKQPR